MEIHQVARSPQAFQQAANEQNLREQLSRELPDEHIVEVTELEAGLFNNVYRVTTADKAYVLKVAPTPDADVFYNERHLMQREQTLAQQLQLVSPLIPRYLSFFSVGDRSAFLQPFVNGRLWDHVNSSLSHSENAELWQQLGKFARTLHSYCGEQFGYPEPLQRFNRWSDFIADNVQGMVEDCRRLGVLCDEIETYCNYLPHFSRQLDEVKTPKLLHGDLWPKNVIIDGAGADIHLKAVLDGERAFWGDPLCDWVLILYGVPEEFWQGYGENLLHTRDPVHIAIYRGMYFLLNILETTRFNESDVVPRERLAEINNALERYL